MKKYILYLIVVLAIFNNFNHNIYGQDNRRERFERERELERDEYLGHKPILDGVMAGTYDCRCGIEDITFNFDSEFKIAVSNYFLVQKARQRATEIAVKRWRQKQNKRIKNYLDSRFHTNFGNFYEARNFLVKRLERRNVSYMFSTLKHRYVRGLNVNRARVKKNISNLKLLKLRENEIRNRKINSSLYPNVIVGGKPLVHYKDLASIKRVWNDEYKKFTQHHTNKSVNYAVTQSPYFNKTSVENYLLAKKIGAYNSYNDWDKLNLMIVLMHYEANFDRLRPPSLLPQQFDKYSKYFSEGTFEDFEKNLLKTRKVGVPIFHKDAILMEANAILARSQGVVPYHQALYYAQIRIKKERKQTFDNLMSAGSIGVNTSVDYLVSNLKVTNTDELEWLNSNPQRAIKTKKFLEKERIRFLSNVDNFYHSSLEFEKERIKNGGLVVKMAKELNLSTSIRKFLYENEGKANQLRQFVDRNKVNGRINEELKSFTLKAISIRKFKYLNENFSYTKKSPFNVDMTKVLDSIKLPNVSSENKIANQKFLCNYNKLVSSNTYKSLFLNTFKDSKKFNVKFIITNLPDNIAGETGGTSYFTNGNFSGADLTIEISRDRLLNSSNFAITRTILHESIHAYLKLKIRDCNSGSSLSFIDNLTLGETIKTFYSNFTCNGPIQSQHEFMFDYMLPTFKSVFKEIGKSNMTSPRSISYVESGSLPLENNPPVRWDWDSFYKYFSMEGLHKTEAFKDRIKNNSLQYDLYKAYRNAGNNFSKNCD